MKRFFCTICQKVKRVRKYPSSVENIHDETVVLRKGVCKWHEARFERAHLGWNTSTRTKAVK